MSAVVGGTSCPNCGHGLHGRYCAGCGQKADPLNPTFRDLAHEFLEETLSVDGRMLRSVRLLLTRPGVLTREYVEGKRVSYVPPLRLYLVLSLVYFTIAAVAPPPRGGTGPRIESTYGDAELRERGFASNAQVVQTLERTLNVWGARAMFVLVPLFAVLVKAAVRDSGRNYPQHLCFALHLHAAAFAILTVGVVARWTRGVPYLEETLGAAAMLWLLAYAVLAFHRAYGGTMVRAVGRTIAVGLVYMTAVGATVVGIGFWMLRPLFM